MDNQIKLLLTEEELTHLKKLYASLLGYQTLLRPLKDTLSGEARRIINYTRKIDTVVREADLILNELKILLSKTYG